MALRSPVPACRPPTARPPHLVVLLHGYGADGNDLIGLAPHWQRVSARRRLRRAQCARPRAGRALRLSMVSHLAHRSRMKCRRASSAAAPAHRGFPGCRTGAAGSAAGAAGAGRLQPGHDAVAASGPAPRRPPAAIVGFSGLAGGARRRRTARGPPVLLAHGDADTVIPVSAMFAAAGDPGCGGRAGAMAYGARHGPWHRSRRPGTGRLVSGLAFGGRLKPQGPVSSPL